MFIFISTVYTCVFMVFSINLLTPNVNYSGRTTSLTSKRCILYIYSTNIGTEYFKRSIYSPYFSLQNAVCFIILTYLVYCIIHILYTGCAKIKKKIFRRQMLSNVKLQSGGWRHCSLRLDENKYDDCQRVFSFTYNK